MDLRKFKDRLRTLGCLSRCIKTLLAREGWYYLGIGRQVKCRACHIEVCLGKFGKGIIEAHEENSPGCKLAKRRQQLRKKMIEVRCNDSWATASAPDPNHPLENARVPSMADAYRRSCTFDDAEIAAHHDEMVDAGFYWSPKREQVVCYYCWGCFEIDQVQSNSKIQHARGRPNCEYINKCLGSEVVKLVQEYFCQEEIPEELITNVVTAKQDSAEVERTNAEGDKPR